MREVNLEKPTENTSFSHISCIFDRVMDEHARSALIKCRPSIMRDLDVKFVLPHLISDSIISDEEKQIIEHEISTQQQAGKLLDIIATKGPGAFDSFDNALREAEYDHLVEDLVKTKHDRSLRRRRPSEHEVRAILIDGAVPPRPNVYEDRPVVIEKIHEAFYKIKDEPGWVSIHGMGGSGKSVLAAESVRDATILSECFPGGVFWASIGAMDQQKLLIKMQNLCTSFVDNENSIPPRNVEEAKARLRFIFAHQHPRALLILDDVWSQFVTKAFDIQCRVLVTTRDQTVMDKVTGHVTKVELSSGFNKIQSLHVFSKWTEIPVSKLPDQAVKIYKETKGSPLAISMIGALLAEHPDRWASYLDKFKTRKVSRFRKSSSYEYSSLIEAVSISVTNLDAELRELYQDFAVFVDDVKVPTAVLQVLWDEDKEFVEDTMDNFVKKSLAQKEWNVVYKTFMYCLHDLQLDYLKESGKKELPKLHRKLIERYKAKCGGEFSKLPNDNYIHWFIGYHMYRAGMNDLMAKVFLDLPFIESKLNITGPADLITDLVKYSTNIIGENNEWERDHHMFLHFLSSNAYKFTEKDLDIIQLALCQPSDTKIYKQAREMALKRHGKDVKYFDWCNRDTSVPMTFLTTKLHEGPVYCAEFSADGKKIVSCSDDTTVKIFDSVSGQELLSLDAHEERINQVHYSPDSKYMVTSSIDKSIKLWMVPENLQTTEGERSPGNPSPSVRKPTWNPAFADKMLSKDEIHEKLIVHTFKTDAEVLVCRFSHNGKFLAAGCLDGSAYIWDMVVKDRPLLHQFQGHELGIEDCAFTNDDLYLATGSQDQSVIVWNVLEGTQSHLTTKHKNMVLSCCFQPGTRTLAYSTDNEIHYCDFESGTCQKKFTVKPDTMILSIAYSPDGNFLAAGDSAYTVMVWDTHTEKLVSELRGHTGWVHYVSFSPDSKKLVSSADDETITVWDTHTEKLVGELRGHTGWVHYVSFSPDSKKLVSSADDETITIWDVETIKKENSIGLRRDFDVLFSADSLIIAAPDLQNRFWIIRNREADIIYQSKPEKSRIRGVAISHDWTKVCYGCEDSTLKVLHLEGNEVATVKTLVGHTGAVRYCRYNETDDVLVTASDDKTLRLWSNDGECKVCEGHTEEVKKCIFFDQDTKVLSSSYDGSMKVWDVKTAECLMTCTGHGEDWVLSCDVSYDLTKFVSCSVDRTLQVFDAETGAHLYALKGHRDCIRSCRFAKNGLLASGDDEGYIRIWDPDRQDEKKLRTLVKHNAWVTDIKWSDDSKTLVSVSDNVKWWNCEGCVLQTLYIRGSFLKRIWASDDFKTFVTIDSAGTLYIMREI